MAIGAKHILLVAVVTLLLTYIAYHGKSSHGDTVVMQGRKSLPNPQFSETTRALAEDSVTETESDATEVEIVEGDALTSTNVESEETTEEVAELVFEEVAEFVSEEVSVEASEELAVEETVETTTEEFTAAKGNVEDVQAGEDVDFVEEA